MARILIVEDEPLIASMLGDWLTEMGHQPVGPAGTVAGAFKILRDDTFDAAIIDVNLGGERSDAIADVLVARGLSVVFATGASADTIGRRFSSCSTLVKPYRFADVEMLFAALSTPVANSFEAVPVQ